MNASPNPKPFSYFQLTFFLSHNSVTVKIFIFYFLLKQYSSVLWKILWETLIGVWEMCYMVRFRKCYVKQRQLYYCNTCWRLYYSQVYYESPTGTILNISKTLGTRHLFPWDILKVSQETHFDVFFLKGPFFQTSKNIVSWHLLPYHYF